MNGSKGPLNNSERVCMRFLITKCKAQIAVNSRTVAKICSAAIGDFGLIDAELELIRGPLNVDIGRQRYTHYCIVELTVSDSKPR